MATIDPTPVRSAAGKRNRDLFLSGSPAHPICYYFEDDGCEELYARFISKLFPRQRSPLVICTGGKTKDDVLRDTNKHKIQPIIFVKDKDFDDLIGKIPEDTRVVTLNRYSFENYLIDESAIIELVIESKRRLKRDTIESDLDLETFLSGIYQNYNHLARLFVVSRRWNLKSIKTTKQSIFDIIASRSCQLDSDVISKYYSKVLSAAQKGQKITMKEELDVELANALEPKRTYAGFADDIPNAHYCGKHLIELILLYVDQKIETSLLDREPYEISMRLLMHTSTSAFERVRNSIVLSAKSQDGPMELFAET